MCGNPGTNPKSGKKTSLSLSSEALYFRALPALAIFAKWVATGLGSCKDVSGGGAGVC